MTVLKYDTDILNYWLVIGHNGWGKALTRDEAMKNAVKGQCYRGRKAMTDYNVYRVHESAGVTGMGDISYRTEHGYVRVESVVNGEANPHSDYMRPPEAREFENTIPENG